MDKDFPGSPVVMNLPSNAGDLGVIHGQGTRKVASQVALVLRNLPANIGDKRDAGLIPWWGRSPGEVNGTLLQHSCLENSMGREAWWGIVHQAPKNQIRLSDWAHHTEGTKIPSAPGHLSPGTTTREMPLHCNKGPTHRSEKTPQATTKT